MKMLRGQFRMVCWMGIITTDVEGTVQNGVLDGNFSHDMLRGPLYVMMAGSAHTVVTMPVRILH